MDMETKLRLCERDIIALVSRMGSMHDALLVQGEALILLTKELKVSRDDAACQRIKENISLWLADNPHPRRAVDPEILKDGDDHGQDRFDGVPADTR